MTAASRSLRVAIDASNLRNRGGVTHLKGLLSVAEPGAADIAEITVWASREVLDQLDPRPWLRLCTDPALDGGLGARTAWRHTHLRRASAGFDVLFAPGSLAGALRCPLVVMSQNMLPFEPFERARFAPGAHWLRLRTLREVQARSFSRADGVIFLSRYALQSILPTLSPGRRRVALIPHGIDDRFRAAPRPARPLASVGPASPLRVLYVSQLSPYKHNEKVAEAVYRLRDEGLALSLDLVGGYDRQADRDRITRLARERDPGGDIVRWAGPVPHERLHERYHTAEAFVFASSCENLPITLMEAMASGLPIACSDRGPMPEALGDAGLYLDPEDVGSIARALRELALSPERRDALAARAFERSRDWSWKRCADATFGFIRDVALAR
ncbi:MAG: glycosyltransferase family 1 protein [Polyangiales bacterium]